MEKKVKQSVNKDKTFENEVEVGQQSSQPEVTLVKSQSSVQIETDSKGVKKYSVKVYDDDPDVAADKALELVKKIEDQLKQEG